MKLLFNFQTIFKIFMGLFRISENINRIDHFENVINEIEEEKGKYENTPAEPVTN